MNLPSLLTGLLCLTLPLWLLAGLGDWLCHRRSQIQHTTGARESALHLLLYLLIALPIVLALFLAIDAMLLVFMAACVLAHMAVSLWDTSFAQPRRYISPLEQQIHSYLEMLPLFALALTVVLHWDTVLHPAWRWSIRLQPLPKAWTLGVLLALLAGQLMIFEELVRCLRAARRPTPDGSGR
jgi:hypothetical protein